MSGSDALKQIRAVAERADVVPADLVARALTCPKWKLLRDWRRRFHGRYETRVGRTILLPPRRVLATYFPDSPVG